MTTAASYARGDSSKALLEETIGANLDRAVAQFGDREALVSCAQDVRYTYAEMGAAVDRLARGLAGAGLARGDRVGIWSPNCAEWTLVQYATAKLGVILVNVNPAYRTSELEFALRQSGCRMLIAAGAFKTSDYRAMVGEVRDACPSWSGWCSSMAPSGTSWRRVTTAYRTTICEHAAPSSTPRTRSTSSTRAGPRAFPRAPR